MGTANDASERIAALTAAEHQVTAERRRLIDWIRDHIREYGSTYAFAKAVGINRGNLHRVLEEYEWNQVIIAQAMGAIVGTPIKPTNGKQHQPQQQQQQKKESA